MKVVTIDALYGLADAARDNFESASNIVDNVEDEIVRYAHQGLLSSTSFNRLMNQINVLTAQRDEILASEMFDQARANSFLAQLNIFKRVSDGELAGVRQSIKNRTRNIFIIGSAATLLFGGLALYVVLKRNNNGH